MYSTVFILVGFLIYYSATHRSAYPVCRDCNVLVISFDSLGANHLPCYGYARDTAPNLCRFAKDNILFQNAYAAGTWTLSSDMSMFTSLYPRYHGMTLLEDYNKPLPRPVLPLPDILKDHGYATYIAVPPDNQKFPVAYFKSINQLLPMKQPGYKEDRDTPLRQFLASVRAGQKTFLFLHSYYLHGPYIIVNQEKKFTNDFFPNIPLSSSQLDTFSEDFFRYLIPRLSADLGTSVATIDRDFLEKLKAAPNLSAAQQLVDSKPDELANYYNEYYYSRINLNDSRQIEYIKALYDQKIFELDSWIGNTLIPFLNNPILQKNTIVVITSEHGEEFMEHGRLTHDTAYDSNMKIPFILAIPDHRGRVVTAPVSSVDLMPTILDAVGVNLRPYNLQGISLISSVFGRKISDRLLYADGYNFDNSPMKTVRNATWKMFLKKIGDRFVPYELYNIQKDPSESDNLLASHLYIAKQLTRLSNEYEKKWKVILER